MTVIPSGRKLQELLKIYNVLGEVSKREAVELSAHAEYVVMFHLYFFFFCRRHYQHFA